MPLLNAFLDSIVCVGFNSKRGFVVEGQSEDNTSPSSLSLNPYVLAILTAEQAIYPQLKEKPIVDQFYPAICYSSTSASDIKSQKKPAVPVAYNNLPIFCSPDSVRMSYQAEESRIHHVVFTQEDGKRSYAVVLTFQEKFILKSEKPDDNGQYQIEPFSANKNHTVKKSKSKAPSSYRYDTTGSNKSSTSTSVSRMRERSSSSVSNRLSVTSFDALEPFYLPHCLVLVSSHPYWTAMQETISIIHDEIIHSNIEPSSDTYQQLIQKYAFLACNTPIPPVPCDRFAFSFTVANNQYVLTLDPPLHTDRTVLDLDLSILLLTLNTGKLVDVLAAILTQQPIIFFSSDYSKLVTTLECLLYLIYPFKWIQIYIPIVPDGLSDYYLEGPPGSYIMGVHSRHQSTVETLDYCLTCSLDTEENLRIPSSIPFYSIPSAKLARFNGPITHFVDQIKTARSLQNINTLSRLSMDEQRALERQDRMETNHTIIDIFLDLMVDLCADTLEPIYWRIDHQQASSTNSSGRRSTLERSSRTCFSREKYLRSKTAGADHEFYKLFIDSTAFQLFLEEEMAPETTGEFQKICQLRSQVKQGPSLHFDTDSFDDNMPPTMSLFDAATVHMVLPLPDWSLNMVTHYLASCVELFTIELENAKDERSQPSITVYAYLRGCALLARGSLLDGLRDLYLIDNSNLFPKTYIETTVVPLLSENNLLDLFLHESFYTHSAEWKKVHIQPVSSDAAVNNPEKQDHPLETLSSEKISPEVNSEPKFIVSKDHLSSEQFYEYAQRLSIIADQEISTIIFNALLHLASIAKKSTDTSRRRRRWSISGSFSKEPFDTDSNQPAEPAAKSRSLPANIPTKLFELFLEIWQQTNAEKARMTACLPKDRQKHESILLISSSDIVSRKDDRSKLILTQKGLYSLHTGHSTASLLTELLKVVYIENYQQKSLFTSTKPAVRIYTSSTTSSTKSPVLQQNADPTVILLFKDNHEQNFWYKIIFELWSAVSIAQKECNATMLNQISRHIAVIDTLACIDSVEQKLSATSDGRPQQNFNQAHLKTALDKLTIFTRLYKSGTYKTLSDETRVALHTRLSPSMNEMERYPVRCLTFTENPDNRYSLLWCAYGQKLKMFNTTTWLCNPSDIAFASLITSMCSDASDKLWIGCADGQVFIVDTVQLIGGTQLASIQGKGGCQSIAFDAVHNRMFIADRSGRVSIWNANNRQRLMDIDLEEIYKQTYLAQQRIYKTEIVLNLRNTPEEPTTHVSSSSNGEDVPPKSSNALKTIQIYENLLFAGYQYDHILVFRTTHSDAYVCEDVVSVKYSEESPTPISSFLVYDDQLWISAGFVIYVFSINHGAEKNSYQLIMKKHLEDDHLLVMSGFSGCIWAGSSRGNVYAFRMDNYELAKTYNGHKDGVCCLCPMSDMYIISGSQQLDTSIVIWENEQTIEEESTTQL